MTETDVVAHALDVAARQWPEEPRSRLLLRLVELGAEALEGRADSAYQRRRQAVEETSGKYDDAFYDGYLEDLRRDWPA